MGLFIIPPVIPRHYYCYTVVTRQIITVLKWGSKMGWHCKYRIGEALSIVLSIGPLQLFTINSCLASCPNSLIGYIKMWLIKIMPTGECTIYPIELLKFIFWVSCQPAIRTSVTFKNCSWVEKYQIAQLSHESPSSPLHHLIFNSLFEMYSHHVILTLQS